MNPLSREKLNGLYALSKCKSLPEHNFCFIEKEIKEETKPGVLVYNEKNLKSNEIKIKTESINYLGPFSVENIRKTPEFSIILRKPKTTTKNSNL